MVSRYPPHQQIDASQMNLGGDKAQNQPPRPATAQAPSNNATAGISNPFAFTGAGQQNNTPSYNGGVKQGEGGMPGGAGQMNMNNDPRVSKSSLIAH